MAPVKESTAGSGVGIGEKRKAAKGSPEKAAAGVMKTGAREEKDASRRKKAKVDENENVRPKRAATPVRDVKGKGVVRTRLTMRREAA